MLGSLIAVGFSSLSAHWLRAVLRPLSSLLLCQQNESWDWVNRVQMPLAVSLHLPYTVQLLTVTVHGHRQCCCAVVKETKGFVSQRFIPWVILVIMYTAYGFKNVGTWCTKCNVSESVSPVPTKWVLQLQLSMWCLVCSAVLIWKRYRSQSSDYFYVKRRSLPKLSALQQPWGEAPPPIQKHNKHKKVCYIPCVPSTEQMQAITAENNSITTLHSTSPPIHQECKRHFSTLPGKALYNEMASHSHYPRAGHTNLWHNAFCNWIKMLIFFPNLNHVVYPHNVVPNLIIILIYIHDCNYDCKGLVDYTE